MSCSWGEAWLLVESLRDDPSSHLGASAAGWSWPASITDLATVLLAQGVLSALMPEGKTVTFPLPWEPIEGAAAEAVAPEVVDEMVERLARYSAIPD